MGERNKPNRSLAQTLSAIKPPPNTEIITLEDFKVYMFKKISERDTNVKEMAQMLDEHEEEFYGNPKDEEKRGLKVRVSELEKTIKIHEKFRRRALTIIAVISGVATFLSIVLPWIGKLLWKLAGS